MDENESQTETEVKLRAALEAATAAWRRWRARARENEEKLANLHLGYVALEMKMNAITDDLDYWFEDRGGLHVGERYVDALDRIFPPQDDRCDSKRT